MVYYDKSFLKEVDQMLQALLIFVLQIDLQSSQF